MDIAAIKARDLSPAVREWLQGLLRKPLNESDEVSLIVRPSVQPTPEERGRARLKFVETLSTFQREGSGVSEAEIDAAVDEAMTSVRPGYAPIR